MVRGGTGRRDDLKVVGSCCLRVNSVSDRQVNVDRKLRLLKAVGEAGADSALDHRTDGGAMQATNG